MMIVAPSWVVITLLYLLAIMAASGLINLLLRWRSWRSTRRMTRTLDWLTNQHKKETT